MLGNNKKRAGSSPACGLGFLMAGGSLIHPSHNLQWLEDNPGGHLSSEGNTMAGGQVGLESLTSLLHFSPVISRRETASVSKGGNSGREQLKACLHQTHLHPPHRQPRSLSQGEQPHAEPHCAQAEPLLSPDAKVVTFLHHACLRDSTQTTGDICVRAWFGWKISWLLDST